MAVVLLGISVYIRLRLQESPIMMAACLLAVLTYIPLFKGLTALANPALSQAVSKAPVVLYTSEFHGFGDRLGATLADAFQQYKPAPEAVPSYKARQFLSKRGVPFEVQPTKPEAPLIIQVGEKSLTGFDDKACEAAVAAAGYPKAADPSKINFAGVLAILIVLIIYVTMGLWTDRGLSRRIVPDANTIHFNVVSVSYRQRVVWRVLALDRRVDNRRNGQFLRGTLVSDRRCLDDVYRRQPVYA